MSHNDFPYLFSFSTVASGIILRFIYPPRQFRIQILKLVFAIRFSFILFIFGYILVNLSSDIEKYPGPRPSLSQKFSICHWDLNSITALSYVKISLWKAHLSINKFDIVCFYETCLDTNIPLDDVNLEIEGYELVRSDHPSQHKRGDVCIYFRNSLSLKILNIYYIQESVSFETQVCSKICTFVSLYRSPSQTSDGFEKFTYNFELNLDTTAESNSHLIAASGDINMKSRN